MTLTITAAQRKALYDQILDRLGGIGDVWMVVCAENFDAAQRLGREYSDDLSLVVDDLGWGEGTNEPIELSTPPEVLRRALSRLRKAAVEHHASQADERAELREAEERDQLVVEACTRVLRELDQFQIG
jgi:hypothetical protein